MVLRSSGGTGGLRGGPGGASRRGGGADEEGRGSAPSVTPSAAGPFRTSSADLLWRPSLFTGRTRAGTRSPSAARLRRPGSAEHVRLDQMIPLTRAAHFHHVDGELVEAGRQHYQLLSATGRTGHRTQMITEHPRHQGELFLATDRAHHRTGFAVELRGAEQVRVGVADLRDAGAPGIYLSQQGPSLERVIHHLSLQSHVDQSTSAPRPWRRDSSDLGPRSPSGLR
jgi:hypothetical protein